VNIFLNLDGDNQNEQKTITKAGRALIYTAKWEAVPAALDWRPPGPPEYPCKGHRNHALFEQIALEAYLVPIKLKCTKLLSMHLLRLGRRIIDKPISRGKIIYNLEELYPSFTDF
jgi:hypothetical protein